MEAIRCPSCRGSDWYRDGYSICEGADGRIRSERVEHVVDEDPEVWCCADCGHELPSWSALARSLDALEAVQLTDIAADAAPSAGKDSAVEREIPLA